ncbi:50S ribosomal subunit protein L30 [Candidatus Tremblaya phenacola PAVE]|nr:50S ribosomal subunit protein L30 [Candidatus Tremblaya phenacola PAVE]
MTETQTKASRISSVLKVQLVRSTISTSKKQKILIKSLGLKKLWAISKVKPTDYSFGILNRVRPFVRIFEL